MATEDHCILIHLGFKDMETKSLMSPALASHKITPKIRIVPLQKINIMRYIIIIIKENKENFSHTHNVLFFYRPWP